MQFHSIDFMVFFPVVLAVYFLVPRKARRIWLLAASYFFYMSWNAVYAVLIATSTILTYLCGLLSERCPGEEGKKKRKLVLAGCIIANLSILAVFKYGNFAIESAETLMRMLHLSFSPARLNLLLPVGISFYTFQALGYSIDVYRGEIRAERNLIRYALFVSFFPQLVAGPIERSKNLLSQMEQIESFRLWNAKRVTSGAILMVWGFFLKMVIADRVALPVNQIFDHYRMYGSTELIAGALGFTIQIYCDFHSYSTIATGAARILGFDLMENFNTPYLAKGFRDFWNRWHISLSTWFRDYLYLPLGGSRKGTGRKLLNLFVVFLVSGLWHGASWHFIAWGAVHALYRIGEEVLRKPWRKAVERLQIRTDCFSWSFLQMMLTFAAVAFAWIFFRADSIGDALVYVKRIVIRPTPWVLFNGQLYELGLPRTEMNILLVAVLILAAVDLVRYHRKMTIDAFLMGQNLWFEWLSILACIWMILVFGKYGPEFDPQQFIYFQF